MLSILVTGSNGQLGTSILKLEGKYDTVRFTPLDIQDLDLTNEEAFRAYFKHKRFDYIVNCAAFTAVDQAETQHEKAFIVNVKIPELLNTLCTDGSSRIIHLSTDYVYNGNHNVPHLEDDDPGPQSVYAHSKLEGEKMLWNNPYAMVIRTSWLYSEFGNNFLKTILRLSKEKTEISVVFDQTGTPTYAGDLAATLLGIIEYSENNGFKSGIYNYSNEGVCSWFDFATEIVHLAGSRCRIKPIRTFEYPMPATRPVYSVMDKSKIKRTFGIEIPYWKDSLKIAIKNL